MHLFIELTETTIALFVTSICFLWFFDFIIRKSSKSVFLVIMSVSVLAIILVGEMRLYLAADDRILHISEDSPVWLQLISPGLAVVATILVLFTYRLLKRQHWL